MKTPQEKILEYEKLFTKKTIPENMEERIRILSYVKAKKKDKLSRRDVADSFFSKYVRIKHSYLKNGIRCCRCVTCNEEDFRKNMQAGHYRSRGCLKYRFDENQVYPQCYTCNVIKSGNYRNYKIFMDKTVGPEQEEIFRNDNGLVKYNIVRYQTNIQNRYNYVRPILEEEQKSTQKRYVIKQAKIIWHTQKIKADKVSTQQNKQHRKKYTQRNNLAFRNDNQKIAENAKKE